LVQKRLAIASHAAAVVTDSVKQNHSFSVLMFREAVPGVQLGPIRSVNRHRLQVGAKGSVHSHHSPSVRRGDAHRMPGHSAIKIATTNDSTM
jgi:hypothetical protein